MNRKKILFWIGLLSVVAIVAACILHVVFFCPPQERENILGLWLTGFGSFGSFGAVIVALYWEPIRNWFSRPVLSVLVDNKTPCAVIGNIDTAASKEEEFIDICIKVYNKGLRPVEKCRVMCEEILTEGADRKYAASDENKFRPLFFTWVGVGDKKTEHDISGAFYGYVKFAEIRTGSSEKSTDARTSSGGNANGPYLSVCLPNPAIKGQNIQFGDETSVIVHITVIGDGAKTVNSYIQISWNGHSVADFKSHPEKLAVTDVTRNIDDHLRK